MSLIFETERLILRLILQSDLNQLHHILIDPYVRKYLCDDQVFSLQQTEEMVRESQTLFEQKQLGLWFLETKQEHDIIGFAGLWYFFDEPQPQLAYALLPTATKKGYATEAATRILDYCFNELGYEYLVASCDQPNVESYKVAERIGMEKVAERIENGNPIVFFQINKSKK